MLSNLGQWRDDEQLTSLLWVKPVPDKASCEVLVYIRYDGFVKDACGKRSNLSDAVLVR